MARINLQDIRTELEKDNWKVISEEYVNLSTEMIFECPEGHKVYAPYKKIRQKRECPICKQSREKIQFSSIPKKKPDTVRILALDQATKVTGWAVFDNQTLINFGTFETSLKEEIERDNAIKNWLISMIDNWDPDYIGLEGIQFQEGNQPRMGVTIFETLARLQGILMETVFEQKKTFKICPTNTWRAHCGVKGSKRADKKRSMQLLIKKWYDITPTEDEADAIGIGTYLAATVGKPLVIENWE